MFRILCAALPTILSTLMAFNNKSFYKQRISIARTFMKSSTPTSSSPFKIGMYFIADNIVVLSQFIVVLLFVIVIAFRVKYHFGCARYWYTIPAFRFRCFFCGISYRFKLFGYNCSLTSNAQL